MISLRGISTLCFVVVMRCTLAQSPAHLVLDITDFGAVSDTTEHSTDAIQTAIDSCYRSGGGTVLIPNGAYKSGTIVLKSNVTLHLDEGATLYASRDIEHYLMPLENATRPVLLYANGASNIGITGAGTIDGRAVRRYEALRKVDRFIQDITENARNAGVEMKQFYIVKPDVSLVILSDCRDIEIRDVTLRESSFWTLHIIKSDRVNIHGVKVYSSLESGVNADGIDINSCSDVTISHCIVETGDDAIVLKTWHHKPCEDITVTHCVLSSSSTALKLGTESHGDFRRIRFSDCTIEDANRGLSIVVRNGGHVEDVTFSNIDLSCTRRHFNWWGNGDPIWVVVLKKNKHTPLGTIDGVVFENINAVGMGTSKIECDSAGHIEDIRLQNVRIRMVAENYPDKRAEHALMLHHVEDLTIDGLNVEWNEESTEPKWASAISIWESEDIVVQNFSGRQGLADGDWPVVEMNQSSDVFLNNVNATEGAKTLLHVKGDRSEDIQMQNFRWRGRAGKALEIASEVNDPNSIQIVQP